MTKYRLNVGINAYDGAPLQGCVNDAEDWTRTLEDAGYWDGATLLDQKATRDRILDALYHYVDRARFGDRFVFTFSGHGSWVPDRSGDEADRRDEVLVAQDFGLIVDDELDAILSRRRFGVRCIFISDSCHSGSVSRLFGPSPARARFLPPSELPLSGAEIARAYEVEGAPVRALSRTKSALISGCSDAEYSYDAYIDGRYRGAFTAAALDTYRPGISLARWHGAITGRLPVTAAQTPELTATTAQRRWTI